MNKVRKTILTDADGVLLDWEWAFTIWMEQHGHTKVDGYQFMYDIGERYGITKDQSRKMVKLFNESASIGFLPPLRDAMYYVKRLHEEHGYVFRCITSLSLNPAAAELRKQNLELLFGPTAFEEIVCLDTGADKDDALEQYRSSGCYWIEDKPENADDSRLTLFGNICAESFLPDSVEGWYRHVETKLWLRVRRQRSIEMS